MSLTTSQLSLSTGSLARLPQSREPQQLVEHIRRIGPPALEILLYGGWADDLDAAATALKALGVPIWSVHGEKQIGGKFGSPDPAEQQRGREMFNYAARFCEAVCSPYLSIHLWDLPDSDADLDRNLAALAEVHDEARRRGVTVLLEVIPVRHHEPIENMQHIVDALGDEALFTLDLEFLGWHRPIEIQLPAIVDAFGERVVNLHIRDFDGHPFSPEGKRRYLRPGQGRIPYERVFSLLHAKPRPRLYTLETSYPSDQPWHEQVTTDLAWLERWMRREAV